MLVVSNETTNKPFSEWSEVFPHAACTVTLVDRLVHRAEVIEVAANSYRLNEAKELNEIMKSGCASGADGSRRAPTGDQ